MSVGRLANCTLTRRQIPGPPSPSGGAGDPLTQALSLRCVLGVPTARQKYVLGAAIADATAAVFIAMSAGVAPQAGDELLIVADGPDGASVAAATDTSINMRRLAGWMAGGLGAGKRIIDCSFWLNMPDQRPAGFEPGYLALDGTLNLATDPPSDSRGNNYPDPTNGNLANVRLAYRAVARAGGGMTPDIGYHAYFFPHYAGVKQPIIFDLEDARFTSGLVSGASVDRASRQALVAQLCDLIDRMRAEQAANGIDPPSEIGFFLWPPAFGDPGYLTDGAADFAPLVAKVDAFFPELYAHSDNFANWQSLLDLMVGRCHAADPDKPIYPFLAPHYAHAAADSVKGFPLPETLWRSIVEATLEACDGLVMWGGLDQYLGGDPETPLLWAAQPDPVAYRVEHVVSHVASGLSHYECFLRMR